MVNGSFVCILCFHAAVIVSKVESKNIQANFYSLHSHIMLGVIGQGSARYFPLDVRLCTESI